MSDSYIITSKYKYISQFSTNERDYFETNSCIKLTDYQRIPNYFDSNSSIPLFVLWTDNLLL